MTTITLYHGTTEENAARIRADGAIRGGSYFGTNRLAVALTPSRLAARHYGPVVIAVRVDRDTLVVDRESRDDDDLDAALTADANVYALGELLAIR